MRCTSTWWGRSRGGCGSLGRIGIDAAKAEVLDDTTYYGRTRQDAANYDLVVNAERLGLDGAAAVVVAEARRRGWE